MTCCLDLMDCFCKGQNLCVFTLLYKWKRPFCLLWETKKTINSCSNHYYMSIYKCSHTFESRIVEALPAAVLSDSIYGWTCTAAGVFRPCKSAKFQFPSRLAVRSNILLTLWLAGMDLPSRHILALVFCYRFYSQTCLC